MRVLGFTALLALVACAASAPSPPPASPAPPASAPPAAAAPASTDGDGDGVPDRNDKCPGDAETPNGHQDDDGCPDLAFRALRSPDDAKGITERVEFAHDSAAIRATSFALLDAIALVLKMQPEAFPTIALEGHAADNEHTPMKLSLARASAVRLSLLARGVDESRLVARASGNTAPGCMEQTEICRAHERTVEFVKLTASRPAAAGGPEAPRPDTDRRPDPAASADKPDAAAVPLERVEFKKGSAALGPDALPNLDVLAGFMKATPAALEITGYADDNERKPDALAQARADAVRRYMLACGVSARYLTTRTERTGRAACRSHSANCSARNGRAELRFVEPQTSGGAAGTAAPAPSSSAKTDGD